MILVDLRGAIVATIHARLPALDCQSHPGRFDLAEIKRIAAKAPAVRVACLGLPAAGAAGSGERDQEIRFAAFVLTTDKPRLPRDVAAINLVESLLLFLPGQRWGKPGVHPVAEGQIKAENLYSSGLDGKGVALWGVNWSQKVRMGDNAWPEGPILSDELYAGGEE
ncbi:MAG: hypothetical protein EPN20_12955 [Magnetospirillum sp.]|nr:MAG: hypothetical protein EPN20_12955 [Magnetospirillum sp.]